MNSTKIRRKCCLITLAATAAVCAQARAGTAPISYNGWYSTNGNRIVESSTGTTATFNGINWFGFETSNYTVQGLSQVSMDSVLGTLHGLGYNLLRIPYCDTIVQDPNTMPANGAINYTLNPTLQGLDSLQVMDKLVQAAGSYGMKVILDQHRPDASGQSPLWYTNPQYPGTTNTPDLTTTQWIGDLTTLATRYKNNSTVIGLDLHNEPHNPATWGTGNPATDWRLAAEQAGNAIQAVNPHLLIAVEGVQSYTQNGTTSNADWGENLQGVATAPVVLNTPNQVIYSAHDYGPEVVGSQPWFSAANYPNNLPAFWDKEWGYISKDNIAPVWVGEFGGPQNDASSSTTELQWINALTSYIKSNNLYWSYWDVNPDSGGTGGLLLNNWATVDQYKQNILNTIMGTSGPATVQPAVAASSGFSADSTGELNGSGGGTGWASGSSWAVNNTYTTNVNVVTPATPMSYQVPVGGLIVSQKAVQLTGAMSNTNVITRSLASPQNGNGVFVSFLYDNAANSGGASTMAAGKQLFVWLGNSNGPRLGIAGTGGTGNEFFVQTDANSASASAGGSIQKGKVYYIVAFLFKSTGESTGAYDRMALWVNPSSGDFFAPLVVASLGTNSADALTSFQTLGMGALGMQNGDNNLFSHFQIGNNWANMVAAPVPEPATLALLSAALLPIGLTRRFRATVKKRRG